MTTVAAIGLDPMWPKPVSIDDVIRAGDQHLGMDVAETSDVAKFTVIGVMDLFLAARIICRRWRWVALFIGLWGLPTATNRFIHVGMTAWFEVALRMVRVGVP